MKKFTTIILFGIMVMTTNLMARSNGHSGGHGGNYNNSHNSYHHHGGGSSGIRLATDIVNLVGASINLLTPNTVVINQTPVYTVPAVTPVIVSQPPVIVVPSNQVIVRPVIYHARPIPTNHYRNSHYR